MIVVYIFGILNGIVVNVVVVAPCYPFKIHFVVIRRKLHVWIGVSVLLVMS